MINKEKIIAYLMHTPYNTNIAVVRSMVGEGTEKFYNYISTTPRNMNRAVLESLLDEFDSEDVGSSIVGTAVVGTAFVGSVGINNPLPYPSFPISGGQSA